MTSHNDIYGLNQPGNITVVGRLLHQSGQPPKARPEASSCSDQLVAITANMSVGLVKSYTLVN